MGKSNFSWGSPSMSEDIFNNMSKTHHKEKIYDNSIAHDLGKSFLAKGNYERPYHEVLVRNNGIDYVADNTYIDGVFDTKDNYEDFEENEYISENDFDGHGNFMDDDYFLQRDYSSCSLYPEDNDIDCPF